MTEPDASAAAVKLLIDGLTSGGLFYGTWHVPHKIVSETIVELNRFTASHAQLVETVERLTRERESVGRALVDHENTADLVDYKGRPLWDELAAQAPVHIAKMRADNETAETTVTRLTRLLQRVVKTGIANNMELGDEIIAALASAAPPDAEPHTGIPLDETEIEKEIRMGSDYRAPPDAPRWRHLKRGTTYSAIASGRAQASERPIVDNDVVTIYRGDDGAWYVRETGEFTDGRFERVDVAPPDGKESE